MLNAKQHEREAEIVTQAGQLSAVTVATNMAGRGVDILLGGNPEGLARRECIREGLVDRHRRVRRPLRRAAAPRSRTSARSRATRSASSAASTCSAPSATSRRRIDNQLRGRSGRQGDPGESRFYLSLEDELMRLFATGLMQRVMDKSFPDDVPLESKMVSQGRRARAGHGRGPQLRDPQGRAQVRRGDERAAQGHLPAPPADPRRRETCATTRSTRSSARSAALVDQYCGGEFSEDWDVDELLDAAQTYFPTRITKEQLDDVGRSTKPLTSCSLDDAVDAVRGEGRARSAPRRSATSSAA